MRARSGAILCVRGVVLYRACEEWCYIVRARSGAILCVRGVVPYCACEEWCYIVRARSGAILWTKPNKLRSQLPLPFQIESRTWESVMESEIYHSSIGDRKKSQKNRKKVTPEGIELTIPVVCDVTRRFLSVSLSFQLNSLST